MIRDGDPHDVDMTLHNMYKLVYESVSQRIAGCGRTPRRRDLRDRRLRRARTRVGDMEER
jgi:hypothetical protein